MIIQYEWARSAERTFATASASSLGTFSTENRPTSTDRLAASNMPTVNNPHPSPSVSVSVGWGGASSFVDKRKGLSFRESVVKLVPEEKAFSGEHDSGWTVPAEQREAT